MPECPEISVYPTSSCPVRVTVEAPENGTKLFDDVTQVAARLRLAVKVASYNWRGAHLRLKGLLSHSALGLSSSCRLDVQEDAAYI